MLELREISKNEFKPFGKIDVADNQVKQVTVDGEVYTKTIRGTKQIEVSEYPYLYCVELDELECFGFSAKVWDYDYGFSSLFRDAIEVNYILSTNNYVYYWESLFYSKRLPKWIKNVYTDKTRMDCRLYDKIEPHCKVKICDYGFNNSLYAHIDWMVVFNCKNKKDNIHFKRLNEHLMWEGINIYQEKETQQVNNAIKLLIKQR